ncbi:nuclear transport factor 2 family protein [Devosia sp.]|uniref:nuclear transport factor 2 family protein n=1 Tax=Devosia sp. TaxID=1871048 RepID=UPI002AFFED83|nr:nuclear transport factor 2 family protein [Devosia sp.]
MEQIDPASPLGRELLAFEDARKAALIAADAEMLDRILANDLQHIHSSGQVHRKADFIAHVRRMGGFLSIERGEILLHSDGRTALLVGSTINRVRRMETDEIAALEGMGTVVAIRGPAGWQVLLSQITLARRAS